MAEWIDRMPTYDEVEAHARRHRVPGTKAGAWLRMWRCADGEMVPDMEWLKAHDGNVFTNGDELPDHLEGDRWRPVSVDCEPVAMAGEEVR